jgi:hypothetical protein
MLLSSIRTSVSRVNLLRSQSVVTGVITVFLCNKPTFCPATCLTLTKKNPNHRTMTIHQKLAAVPEGGLDTNNAVDISISVDGTTCKEKERPKKRPSSLNSAISTTITMGDDSSTSDATSAGTSTSTASATSNPKRRDCHKATNNPKLRDSHKATSNPKLRDSHKATINHKLRVNHKATSNHKLRVNRKSRLKKVDGRRRTEAGVCG